MISYCNSHVLQVNPDLFLVTSFAILIKTKCLMFLLRHSVVSIWLNEANPNNDITIRHLTPKLGEFPIGCKAPKASIWESLYMKLIFKCSLQTLINWTVFTKGLNFKEELLSQDTIPVLDFLAMSSGFYLYIIN